MVLTSSKIYCSCQPKTKAVQSVTRIGLASLAKLPGEQDVRTQQLEQYSGGSNKCNTARSLPAADDRLLAEGHAAQGPSFASHQYFLGRQTQASCSCYDSVDRPPSTTGSVICQVVIPDCVLYVCIAARLVLLRVQARPGFYSST